MRRDLRPDASRPLRALGPARAACVQWYGSPARRPALVHGCLRAAQQAAHAHLQAWLVPRLRVAGNSPVQIHKRQFAAIADSWFKLSIAIKNDTEADREFGWVQEM